MDRGPDLRPVRVAIAGDCPMLCEGLWVTLERSEGIAVVGLVTTDAEFSSMIASQRPDVLLLAGHPATSTVTDLVARARVLLPQVGILVIANHDLNFPQALSHRDVQGSLSSSATGPEIVSAVRLISSGKTIFDSEASRWNTGETAFLTPTERTILKLLVSGKRNVEIATELDRTEKTVEYHLTHIFAKLDVRSRTEAVIRARELGIDAP
jgi:DNA-binding NarL/FixJ family response regulator